MDKLMSQKEAQRAQVLDRLKEDKISQQETLDSSRLRTRISPNDLVSVVTASAML